MHKEIRLPLVLVISPSGAALPHHLPRQVEARDREMPLICGISPSVKNRRFLTVLDLCKYRTVFAVWDFRRFLRL